MMRKSWKEAGAIQILIRYKIYSKTLIVRNYIKKFSIILMMEKVLVCTVSLFSVTYICAVGVGGMEKLRLELEIIREISVPLPLCTF